MLANRRAAPPSPMASPPAPAPAPASSASSSTAAVSKYPRFGRRGAPQAFPSKLYEILEGENPDIIGWTATGRGFEVRDHARLSSEVLGRFFKQDKFSSFQRQLNLYGFRKITKGSESGSYQHPHFRRGERTTLLTIRRSTKASPARVVVPVSPASTGSGTPPPAVPLNNDSARNKNNGGFGGGGGGNKTDFGNNSSSTVGANMSSSAKGIHNSTDTQPRSATPSPPPATVSRGVLWPRPPVLDTAGASQQQQHTASGAREVSPDGGMNKTAKVAPADRHQQHWSPSTAASEGGSSNSWESHADHSRVAGHAAAGTGDAAAAPAQGGGGAPAERSALDHQDAEVVSLLQRMAKEAQDSPSRKRAALAAQRWEDVQQLHHHPASVPPPQRLQQPQFQMPRQAAAAPGAAEGSDEPGQSHQTVFAERLYDILSHERSGTGARAGTQQAGYYSSAFGADGRVTSGFPPHLQHHQLNEPPSSFGTSTASPSPEGSPAHLPQPPVRNDSFESAASAHRESGGRGGSEAGDGAEMGMSEQDRQILLARRRSGPSSGAASAAAAQQDRQVLLARSRSGPADFNREDHHHRNNYYHTSSSSSSSSNNHNGHHRYRQHDHGAPAFDHSPGRGGGGGEYSFEGTRYGSHTSGPSGVLPPLPSLNFEQFSGGGVDRMRRAPWHGAADSTYVK
eukprot:g6578.t1